MFNPFKTATEKKLALNIKKQYMEELIQTKGWQELTAATEDLMTELHKELIAGKISLDFYRGIYCGMTLLREYPKTIKFEALTAEEAKRKEEEDEL